jgi:hypothetical protein
MVICSSFVWLTAWEVAKADEEVDGLKADMGRPKQEAIEAEQKFEGLYTKLNLE